MYHVVCQSFLESISIANPQRALQNHASKYITPHPKATASLHNTCPAQSTSHSHLLVYHEQVVAARKAIDVGKLLQVQL